MLMIFQLTVEENPYGAIKTYIYMDKRVSCENETASSNQGDVYVFGI